MIKTRNILLLGSGLMAESVVNYLLKRPQNKIHIASNIVEDAKKIALKKGIDRCSYSSVNVQQNQSLKPLVMDCEIVISYVPAFLHIHVARVCLQLGKHLVTASYVTPQLKSLNEEVVGKNLIFLNELGLDPGIDHLATMKIIHDVQEEGGKIIQYESWCGGLPSPQSCDNPLGYKFTWSPIGAFRALNNKAKFIENDKEIQIQSRDLLYYGHIIEVNQALSLEGYPNRNSISYKQLYNLKDCKKVLRGTLRYKGFCEIMNSFKQIGLMDQTPVKGQTWVDYLVFLLEKEEGNNLYQKIRSRCIDKVKHYSFLSSEQKQKKYKFLIKSFKFFGLFNPQTELYNQNISNIQNLIKLLQPKLSLKEGETDLIAMQHKFLIEIKGKKIIKTSSLIQIGQKNGSSAMSQTVGTPTAIGAQLILDGKVPQRGVIIPIYKDLYIPILQQLGKVGIKLFDVEEEL